MKKRFQTQEESTARELGGKRVTGSGSKWYSKGDVRTPDFLLECKTTAGTFYTLKYQTWEKIKKEALKDGIRIPVMRIDTEDGKYSMCVIDFLDFYGLGYDEMFCFTLPSKEPYLHETRQMRLTSSVYDIPYSVNSIPREDMKFVEFKTHLVILRWEDFLYMRRKMREKHVSESSVQHNEK